MATPRVAICSRLISITTANASAPNLRLIRFSDHFSPDTASTNHCALMRPTEVSNIILCLHLRQTTKPHMSFGTLVRFGSTAEVALSDCDVRFYLNSGHQPVSVACPLGAS